MTHTLHTHHTPTLTMKHTAACTALLTLVLLTTAALTSCTKRVNDPAALAGTWLHTDDDSRDYLTFNADGTGYKWEEPLTDVPSFTPIREAIYWNLADGRLTIVEPDGDTDIEHVRQANDELIKIGDDYYARQNTTNLKH